MVTPDRKIQKDKTIYNQEYRLIEKAVPKYRGGFNFYYFGGN
jgi:hypothetical protein